MARASRKKGAEMKWLFLVMVLGNAGFVAWQGFSAADAGVLQQPVYAPPVSERIYLVGEVRPDESDDVVTPVEQQPLTEADKVLASLQREVDKVSTEDDLLCPIVTLERNADTLTVMDVLRQQGLAFSERKATGKRDKYWLYISAPATAEKAQDIVAALKLKRIDSYVISRGDMKNRISLGLFSSKDRAEQAQASISEQSGMDVNIYAHQREVGLTELLLAEPITSGRWDSVMMALDFSKLLIKIEKNPC